MRRDILNSSDLEIFARTLSSLLEGGVPILKALLGLERTTTDLKYKKMLQEAIHHLQEGDSLSKGLKKTGCIPAFFYQMIHAGEISGKMSEVLGELSKYLFKEVKLKRSIRDSLVYPVFIAMVGFATLIVLVCVVLPKLQVVYYDFGQELPLFTQMILVSSRYFLPVSILIAILISYLFVTSQSKGYPLTLLGKIGPVRNLISEYIRIRFSRLLHLLSESGVSLSESLNIIETTFASKDIRSSIVGMRQSIASGNQVNECVERISWMDAMSKMLIASGEEAGRLDAAFAQIAKDTEASLESKINLIVKLIEPTVILVIGLAVGVIVVGAVLPIFDMGRLI